MRIGIVEDDPASRSLLTDYVARYESEHGLACPVTGFSDGQDLLSGFQRQFDLLLLDIQMPGLDGFSTAERVRRVDPDVVIVFITNTPQYAIHGYEVDALSYLLKPVPYFAFARELTRSVERLARRTADYVVLSSGTDLVRLDTRHIVYLESVKHHLLVNTLDHRHTTVGTLKAMEATLAGRGFFRSNSCYLVNLRHVTAVHQSSCVMSTGVHLVVSRPRKKDFLIALTDYLGEGRPT
ncbi:MAG: LytTR family DNA-binding domain-containing protein [Propionibacteriaceae bacterium]|jgi:DNA-binding LytR/AlgR family response regulator|nr:LytTR family DNA-binding domain-containing protein [Propionibacteriaceae bacterium]